MGKTLAQQRAKVKNTTPVQPDIKYEGDYTKFVGLALPTKAENNFY